MKLILVLVVAMMGMVTGFSVSDQDEALANSDVSFINFASADDRSEFVRKLQEALKRTVDTLKQKLDQGREKADELIVRAEKLAVNLKKLGADMGQKLRHAINEYEGRAKLLLKQLGEFFRRRSRGPSPQTERPEVEESETRVRRSIIDRLPEIDEEKAVSRICDHVVRLALPSRRDQVRERCERHARAVIDRLNRRRHPDSALPEATSDPAIESELDFAEGAGSEFTAPGQ